VTEETQAARIIDRWPGDTRPERRRALAASLDHPDDEKVRYWEKKGEIPLREWQGILDAAAAARVELSKQDFVGHLKDPAETAATASAAA
jgi:hypothetical protein